MEKTEFSYRNNIITTIWYLLLAAPVILLKEVFVDRIFSAMGSLSYLIIGTLLTIGIILYLWRNVLGYMPGVQQKGYYWLENGILCMQLGDHSYQWNHVTELFVKEREWLTGGVRILIKKGDKESIWLLSEYLEPSTDIRDTAFVTIFRLVLAGNPALLQEKDMSGNLIEYFYKSTSKDN